MRRKIEKLKELFLTISKSNLINWIAFFVTILGVAFNVIPITGYKILVIFIFLEVLMLNANKFDL